MAKATASISAKCFLTGAAFLLAAVPVFADDDLRLVIKNSAGYPIYHMSVSRMEERPEIDILDAPLQPGQSVDLFLSKSHSSGLLLWLFNEDYTNLTVELGDKLDMVDYIEILNDGSLRFVLDDDENKYIKKKE